MASLYGRRLTWIWVPGDFLSPTWHCYITTLIWKLLDFCVLPISPTWDSTPKFPNWKGVVRSPPWKQWSVVSWPLFYPEVQPVYNLKVWICRSLMIKVPLPQRIFPQKEHRRQFFQIRLFLPKSGPTEPPSYIKEFFFHAQNPLHRWSWCLLAAWNALQRKWNPVWSSL